MEDFHESYDRGDPRVVQPLRYMGWAYDLTREEGSWTYRIYAPDTEDHGPTASEMGFGCRDAAELAARRNILKLWKEIWTCED